MEKIKETLKGLWTSFYTDTALTIVYCVIFLILGLIIIKIVQSCVKKATIANKKLDNAASSFITSVVTVVLYVGLLILLLSTLGVSTTGLVAGFSAVALAVALGLQDTLSSITNGIVIIFTKPFKQGDYIEVDGVAGIVKHIKLFNTTLNTYDNLTVVIPNNTILSSSLINYSTMPLRRVDITVPCPYSVNTSEVKKIVFDYIAGDRRIANDPAPACCTVNFSPYALEFSVKVWCKTADYWDVKFDLIEGVFNKLRDNGINIPVNRLDVRIDGNMEDKNDTH